jgi:hypothetical protein
MGANILCNRLDFTLFPGLEFHERWLPNWVSMLAPALLSGHGSVSGNALRPPALTGFPLHPGSVRLGVFRSSIDDLSADPLVPHRVAIRVQNNFHPVPSTQLCEQSGNMVHDFAFGNLELRGNLIVRQADRNEAYQLFVSLGELRCFLILHIAFVDRVKVPEKLFSRRRSRESPLPELYAEFQQAVSQSRHDFKSSD